MARRDDEIRIAVTGDLVLDEPEAGYWLSGIAPELHRADLAIGHVEVPHTRSDYEADGDIPAPGAPPENLTALAEAGFNMVSLAGNHIADCGPEGIADTLTGLNRSGILHAGAGPNIAAARKPAVAVVKGWRIALLSYNCVGPELSWAGADKAGCAFLRMTTADGSPVSPRADLDGIRADAVEILREDIALAKAQADRVIVALHKGIVHTPARLAPYERGIAHLAVEQGADAVISHHAHIVRGIEFHCARPIFHGLGNGCVVTRALSPDQDNARRADWARKRKEMFGFEPDPDYFLAPFHPEAVNAFIGQIIFRRDEVCRAAIVPVHVEAPGRPVLATGQQARGIANYVEAITTKAGLPAISITDDGAVEAVS